MQSSCISNADRNNSDKNLNSDDGGVEKNADDLDDDSDDDIERDASAAEIMAEVIKPAFRRRNSSQS